MWEIATKTEAGLALDARLMAAGKPLTVTAARCAEDTANAGGLAGMTGLTGKLHEALLRVSSLSGDGRTVSVPVTLTNAGAQDPYRVRQVGVFASDPDGGEVLYFVAYDAEGNLIPSELQSPGFSVDWNFFFRAENAEEVAIQVSEAGKLTVGEADSRYSRIPRRWEVAVPAAGWKGEACPFTNTVSVEGMDAGTDVAAAGLKPADESDAAAVKAEGKAFGLLMSYGAATGEGTVTFRAYKRPAADFTVILEESMAEPQGGD